MLNEPQMLPAFVRSMEQMQDLLRTEQAELDRTEAAIRDATDQLYINSATWTLARWERLFGLPSNDSVPAELRGSNSSQSVTPGPRPASSISGSRRSR